ncbi:MAG TPA: class D sortase [Gaiellaceae bacterium]|nr:class D sortase [Gaiellaceae bacterium]
MRRFARLAGAALIAAGLLTSAWTFVVWQWQDPFTALYTTWEQRGLARQLQREMRAYRPERNLASERAAIAVDARRFQLHAQRGHAIGRIVIGRIGLNMVVVDGADHESLKKGPGLDTSTYMPGEHRLVYIVGHRTTYLAPFAHINDIKPGDYVRLEMPYATFVYRAYTHRIVAANDLSVLRSPRHELLELQACHPRFFATHRYIVYARLVAATLR